MNRWQNCVAIVTGASSGIGAKIVEDLIRAGLIVLGLARREDKIIEIRDTLPTHLKNSLHSLKCDVTKEDDVISAFNWVEKKFGGVHVLINNAGILPDTELTRPGNTKDLRAAIDINIMGVALCTREAFNLMKKKNIDGHIVIINSTYGHKIPYMGKDFPSSNIYPATKHAITAMTEVYRQEFLTSGTKIKITSISPGGVNTDIFPKNINNIIKSGGFPLLQTKDVSNAVLYALGTPPHVQVHDLIIKPLGEVL